MKLSNATIYRSMFPVTPEVATIEEAMQAAAFVPCGASQESSVGWVPPRGEEHGALLEAVAGQWIAKVMIESKSVPASVVRRKLVERCANIEATTGRKPGAKEKKQLKEDLVLELLPLAFPKIATIDVWLDPVRNVIVVNTPSQSKADLVATMLVQAVKGLSLSLFNTAQQPSLAMASWLLQGEAGAEFFIDRAAELTASDESRSKVQYTNHPLDTDEVRDHIRNGFRPTKLALTWQDRVSFVLTEGMSLRSITFLEGTATATPGDRKADDFDADVAISTGEASNLIAALVAALGGESQMTIADAVRADAESIVGKALDGLEEQARSTGATISVESGGKTLLTFGEGPDPMLAQARAIVIEHDKASISLVQRHLKIGYNRAASLIEALEKAGDITAADAMGIRKVKAVQ